jgi:hypothetical protein
MRAPLLPLAALKAIGADAVPYLSKALRQKDNPLRTGYARLYPKLTHLFGNRLPLPVLPAVYYRRGAVLALANMIDVAKPAYAALLAATNNFERFLVRKALKQIGSGAVAEEGAR